MKICWDNLENLEYVNKLGLWRRLGKGKSGHFIYFEYVESCKECKEPFLAFTVSMKKEFCSKHCSSIYLARGFHPTRGKHLSAETRKKIGDSNRGSKNWSWQGGVKKKKLCLYDTYAPQLIHYEKVQRDPLNTTLLQVACAYCGKMFIPKYNDVWHRILSINGRRDGESRLYCSNECKNLCPIYKQIKYFKFQKKLYDYRQREVQPELRQMVFERDNWTCQKCGATKSLECHHVEGIHWEPLMSADVGMCITYCSKCHNEVHQKDGCSFQEMKCE